MYTREARFEALAIAGQQPLTNLADRILAEHPVQVLRPPTSGAVMMRAIETAEGSLFNLGEVAVTEAEVELGGQRGYCMLMGYAPERALAAAVIDAAAEAGLLLPDIHAALDEAIAARERSRDAEWTALAPTRVEFDEIPE